MVTLDQRASQQLPVSLSPTLLAPLNSSRYQGLVAAASILGGAPVFLFLFARVSLQMRYVWLSILCWYYLKGRNNHEFYKYV